MGLYDWNWTGFDIDAFVDWTNRVGDSLDPKHVVDSYMDKWNSDDPREYDKLYDDPLSIVTKPLLDWNKNKHIRADAERYYDDIEKNTGQTYDNSPYRWKDYYEKGLGRYSGFGSSSELFEASMSVINSFNRRLMKW